MEIIILAGGKGTRMNSDIPKCLVPVRGVPMIFRILKTIQPITQHKPIVVVGYKAQEVKDVLSDTVRYAHQTEQKGTGHATRIALEYLLPSTKHVIVLHADQPFVSRTTIESLISGLSQSPVVMVTADAGDFSDWKSAFVRHGRIVHSDGGSIEKIVEYKDADEKTKMISKINPAFYAFQVEWLKTALEKLVPQNVTGEYYLTDVIKMAQEGGHTIGEVVVDTEEALGFNSKEEIAHAEKILKE